MKKTRFFQKNAKPEICGKSGKRVTPAPKLIKKTSFFRLEFLEIANLSQKTCIFHFFPIKLLIKRKRDQNRLLMHMEPEHEEDQGLQCAKLDKRGVFPEKFPP